MKSILSITEVLGQDIDRLQSQLEQSCRELLSYQVLLFSELLQNAASIASSLDFLIKVDKNHDLVNEYYEYYEMTAIEISDKNNSSFLTDLNIKNIIRFFNRVLLKSEPIQDVSFTEILTKLANSRHFNIIFNENDSKIILTVNTNHFAIQWFEKELCQVFDLDLDVFNQIKINRERMFLLENIPSSMMVGKKSSFL